MKKIAFILVLCSGLFFMSGKLFSQPQLQGTIGVNAPIGDFGLITNINTGASLNATFRAMLNDNIGVGANAGVNRLGNSWLIPVTGLFEYHFPVSVVTGYGGVDMGLYLWSYRFRTHPVWGGTRTETRLCFGFAPTVGAIYDFSDELAFTANMKTHFWVRDGMRIAIAFNAGAIMRF